MEKGATSRGSLPDSHLTKEITMLCKSLALATGLALLAFATPTAAQLGSAHPSVLPAAATGSFDGVGGFVYDDGSAENALGLTAGGQIAYLHWFDPPPGGALLTHVDAAVGSPGGSNPPAGGALTVFVWDDANNDGNPGDAVLIATGSGVVTAPGTDTIVQYTLSTPVTVTSRFFVGAMTQHAAGAFPAAMDESQGSGGRAWVVGSTTATFNPANLLANDVPPSEMDSIGFPSVFLLRAGGPTWVDLGNALAGAGGTPLLVGSGATSGGQPVALTLTGAAANAPAHLVTGVSVLNAAFKGGVLVPNPDFLASLTTDGGGGLVLGGNWPTFLAPGRTLTFQYWIVDATGPMGFAASNAVSGTTQ